MEEKHSDLLLLQRANLVAKINMRGGLLTQLLARKVIDPRGMRVIKTHKTLDEMCEEMLDILPQCGSKAFELFCEALKADGQEEIVSLYLKTDDSESKGSDSKSSGVQESNTSKPVTETRESSPPGNSTEQLSSPRDDAQVVSDGSSCFFGIGTRQGQSSAVPVTIHEEFEQQRYRRSIEPVPPRGSDQSSGCHEYESEQHTFNYDTRSLRNSVYSVITDSKYSRSEKEKILLQMGIKQPIPDLVHGFKEFGSKFDPLRDFIHSYGDSFSSSERSGVEQPSPAFNQKITQPPYVFLHSPKKANIPSSYLHHEPTHFLFNTKDQIESGFYKEKLPLGSDHMAFYDAEVRQREAAYHRQPDIRQRIVQPTSALMRQNSELSDSQFLTKAMFSENSKQVTPNSASKQSFEREIYEIPRHVELTRGLSEERQMMNLPRHIEMRLPVGRNPDHEDNKETHTPKLCRNDSVDTMHKRPFAEDQQVESKRFREDVDSIPVLMRPRSSLNLEALPTINTGSSSYLPNIPVLEVPKRKPSRPRFEIQTDTEQERNQRSSLLGAMDDPEIDLTDGPIDVKVELCSRQFYLQNYKKAYAMRRIPRGKALILNVNAVVGKTERRGTDIDRDNLDNLLCQLHFDVTVYNDSDGLTAIEMVKKLQDFSQHPGHAKADCTVVCILSHGEEGYIFGADGRKFELDAIFQLFDNTCCPDLRGKPKLFIIQACRGGALDKGVQYYPDEHDGTDARVRQVPSMSDMLTCYPTQNGYYAWRNRDRGSWYVEALVQVFMKYAQCEDVCTMLNRVNLLVSKKVSHCPNLEMDQMSQMSEYKSTLRMPHMFFFPGIGGTYENQNNAGTG